MHVYLLINKLHIFPAIVKPYFSPLMAHCPPIIAAVSLFYNTTRRKHAYNDVSECNPIGNEEGAK